MLKSKFPRESKLKRKNKAKISAQTDEEKKKRLPLSVNAAILLMFCMLGGMKILNVI